MYRIISGKWKAKKIAAPKNFNVRPTTDFAKEALFSILENRFAIGEISVLDLFAGIGSISLEFASRYCQDITSVDVNYKHIKFIETTAQELGFSQDINPQRSDVFEWLKKGKNHHKKFDVIFADPPFDLEKEKYSELIDFILKGDFLSDKGVFILEHQSQNQFEHELLKNSRKYGNVTFSFFEKE